MIKIISKFDAGLSLDLPLEQLREGEMRRNRAISNLSQTSFKSRLGSSFLHALNAHSLIKFADTWFSGVSTKLYFGDYLIKSGLSGDRLSFSKMPPVAGIVDYLFVAGGDDLFKSDSSGNVSNWGITPPSQGTFSGAASGASYASIRTAAYRWRRSAVRISLIGGFGSPWTLSGGGVAEYYLGGGISNPNTIEVDGVAISSGVLGALVAGTYGYGNNDALGYSTIYIRLLDGTDPDVGNYDIQHVTYIGNEYFCELAAGGNPSITDPNAVTGDDLQFTEGTIGVLTASKYAYGNNETPSLGFNTIYVCLADTTDPDTKALNFVKYTSEDILGSDTFQYRVTFKNSTTGTRSNSHTTAISVASVYQQVILSNIPQSSDSQVDKIEIWRTSAGGILFFYLSQIDNGTTTYTDDGSITLSATELPTDNLVPYNYLDDCLGPYNASMFWITRSQSGQKGRLFYSPIGRAEALEGFINITADSNPLQKIFRWQGQIGVIAQSGIFLIDGANPYTSREIPDCPGTNAPHTVIETPSGLFYTAFDGIRIFNGATSELAVNSFIDNIFFGNSIGDLNSFSPIIATFARYEYIIASSTQTIAFDTRYKRFRDLGIDSNALAYDKENNQLAITINSEILSFESSGEFTDHGTALSLSLEPGYLIAAIENEAILQFLNFDINTSNEQLSATLIIDNISHSLGLLQNSSRGIIELPIGKAGKRFGIKLTGSLTIAQIELFYIQFNFYLPGEVVNAS